jgi:hypothetical protein
VQPKHADFAALNVKRTLKQYEKPCSCIIALKNGTMLHFYYGPEKTEEIVILNAGDVIIFAGDLLHAGGAWTESVENYRLFAYWPTDEFLVRWEASLAVGGSQPMHPNNYKVTRPFAAKMCLLADTNPISASFKLETFKNYLYDSEQFNFYNFDPSLYFEGIAAHIDYKHDNKLPFVYSSAHVPVNFGTKCPHFSKDNLPKMTNEELHACVRRCVYCVKTTQHAQIIIKLTGSIDSFSEGSERRTAFISGLAAVLRILEQQIVVISVTAGSVIVKLGFLRVDGAQASPTEVVSRLKTAAASGALDSYGLTALSVGEEQVLDKESSTLSAGAVVGSGRKRKRKCED